MKKLKKSAVALIILYIILNLAILPEKCTYAARYALRLCFNIAIPSLFPFFVASSVFVFMGYAGLLSRFLSPFTKSAFNVCGAGATAVVMGMISGYPVGAATCSELYKKGELSKTEAERLLAFTNNSGPIFVIGALGSGIFGSKQTGFLLYFSHIISAVLVGIVFKYYKRNSVKNNFYLPPKKTKSPSFAIALAEGINSSVQTMLKVCGFIILFSVVASCLPKGNHLPFTYSLFEITGGLNLLAQTKLDDSAKLCLVSFFLGLSGLSVFCQVQSILCETNLSIKPYIFGKFLQGTFSTFITKLLLPRFDIYTPVSSVVDDFYGSVLPKSVWQASLSVIMFALLLMLFLLVLGYFFEKRK